MAHLINRNLNDRIEKEANRKRWVTIGTAAGGLAMIGVVSAFAWRAYGSSPYPSFALGTDSAGATAPESVRFDEFRVFQQQIVGQLQSSVQALAAQQAGIKRLSDQMTVVAAKIDALQSSLIPTPEPHAALQPKKATKPNSARISTGGALLPPPVELTR